MISKTFKRSVFIALTFLSATVLAQTTAPDEDTGPITECRSGFSNATRDSSEYPGGAVNDGKIDDRSCYSDYDQVNVYNKTWGVYNITDGSNHLGTSLQPRIERSLPRSQEVGVGSYARFSGTVRILEVGDAAGTDNDGTYMMQSKGKHTGGGGSPDPAICLYLVKPVIATDSRGRQYQKSFKLYREQIKFRGGSGKDGRDVVFLTDINKDEQITVVLEVGFRQDPNDPTKRIHYSDATIGGRKFAWNIPEPERGVESGIRYGAYRVHGGRAQIRWADTDYQMKEVVFDPNAPTNSAPEVAVTGPANNATFTVGETITLTASASDPDGNLEKVNFLINDVFHKTVTTRPFTTTFTPTVAGRYKIAARAFDKTGIFKEEFISITVEEPVGAAPQISITSPANGATFELGQEIAFSTDATDADGNLEKVNFFANNEIFKSDNTRPFDAVFNPTVAGTYQIIARAIDTDNNKTDATISIEVVAPNQNPTASFDQSVVNTLEEAYTDFVVTVNASDADGEIQSVVLFIDDQEIRSEAAAPYEWGHDSTPSPNETLGLSVGEHVLKAVITDNDGASITINKTITVTAKPVEVVEYFKFRNVATGEYLTNSSPSITMSADAQGDNKNWGLASSGNYSNIVNQQLETLRATGANYVGGAYAVVQTSIKATTTDSDKIWNLIYNSSNNTYRIQAGDNNRFLYQNTDNTVTTSEATATDTRSMWELVSLDDASLSIFDLEKVVKNVKLYPNPVVDKFTMSFAQVDAGKQKQIEIYSLSGKLIYTSFTNNDVAEVNLPNLSGGIYMVKVSFAENKVFYSKLLVK